MSDFNFNAPVKDVTVYSINKFLNLPEGIDIEINDNTALVKYYFDIEAREWGVKSIAVIFQSIAYEINWWLYIDDLTLEEIEALKKAGGREMRDGTIEGTKEINSTVPVNGKEWTIKSDDLHFGEDGSFSVDSITFELKDLTIHLS